MSDKTLISVKEASDLFGIGERKIRDLLHNDTDSRYHMMVGRVMRVKRQAFENFLGKASQI